MIFDLLLDLASFFDRSNTLYAAYKAAWKNRVATGDDSPNQLFVEMKKRSVPGAYDGSDSPRISPALLEWASGIEPREARKALRDAPTKRQGV